jgi:hypothetical protein
MMLTLAAEYPEYAETAKKVQLTETTSGATMVQVIRTYKIASPKSPILAKNWAGRQRLT